VLELPGGIGGITGGMEGIFSPLSSVVPGTITALLVLSPIKFKNYHI